MTEAKKALLLLGIAIARYAPPERHAGVRVAAFVAGAEPVGALGCAAVGEALGHDLAAAGLLQGVVADGGGGGKGAVDVPRVHPSRALVAVRPDASVAVGLQLQRHADLVGAGRVAVAQGAALQGLGAVG